MNATTGKTSREASAPGKQARIAEIDGRHSEASRTLMMMTTVMKLACFASEARRTLNAISAIQDIDPEFAAVIRERVDASSQWLMCPDELGNVLAYVSDEVGAAREAMEQAFTELSREATDGNQSKGGAA